ncbi:protein PTST2, chloroplastic [Sesamum alatum]|uniref:Protein PTST2, chloroplastic n=1 Tax=Sesamum alatum TaxID=300844 RepID=A0AAE1Y612_9LAMI|nr:protein PTST2, chloroplastic [Sesamum alatum]
MLSPIATHIHIPKPDHPLSRLNYPLISSRFFMHNSRNGVKRCSPFSGFMEVKTWGKVEGDVDDSWCCCCKRFEGDIELDEEIIEFMEKSEKPKMFPTKEELLRAGRMDLVEGIKKSGGWYSLGWDEGNVGGNNVEETMEDDIGEFQRRVEIENCKERAALREEYYNSCPGHEEDCGFSSAVGYSNPGELNSLQLASSASLDRSLEVDVGEATGIEGILIGLEKQRITDFGINLRKYDHEAHAKSKDAGDDRDLSAAIDGARADPGGSSVLRLAFQHKGRFNTFSGKINPNHQVGVQHAPLEAAEFSFSKNQVESNQETYYDGETVTTEKYAEACNRHEDINHHQLRTRLQHLEVELTTALCTMRSKREQSFPEEGIGSSNDLQKLSDAWEFQENKFMSAQDALRSIRSKLAVLQGKMTLAIIDAQKIVELKQKRIDTARKALQLLRTTP